MHSKNTYFSKKTSINCGGELIDLSVPKVMGVLNVTPDSFYDGGRNNSDEAILLKLKQMLEEGADFIDIGAYSSRPGAKLVSEKEELSRLTKVLDLVHKKFKDIHISVDTYRSQIAKIVVNDYGVEMINDISAGELDDKMFETIAELNVPYIMMHMKGEPATMQVEPEYEDITKEIIRFFHQRVTKLKNMGVNDIIIDPGFGFGKTLDHNYQLLNQLDSFDMFDLPILVGVSRKSMIYKYLGLSPDESLNGTTVLNTLCLSKGVNILRVHDVKEAKESIKLVEKLKFAN